VEVNLNLANLLVCRQCVKFDFAFFLIVAIFYDPGIHLLLCAEAITKQKVEVYASVLDSHELQILDQALLFGLAPLFLKFF